MIERIWNEFSFHTVFMKLVVCFYIPSPKARGYKTHNSFHKYRMKWKFISDPIYTFYFNWVNDLKINESTVLLSGPLQNLNTFSFRWTSMSKKEAPWFWNYFIWLRITDEGSVPDMRIWSILLIQSKSLFIFVIEYNSGIPISDWYQNDLIDQHTLYTAK